jgi:hypothetical protein
MDRAGLDGIELECETLGSGEPVVLIHRGHFADWFTPILNEPALTDRYRVVSYHTIGADASPGDRAGAHRGPLLQREHRLRLALDAPALSSIWDPNSMSSPEYCADEQTQQNHRTRTRLNRLVVSLQNHDPGDAQAAWPKPHQVFLRS